MSGIIRSRRREAKALHRGSLLRRVAAPAFAVLAGLWAPAASADILLWSANSDLPQTFTYPNTGFVDLNGTAAGGASLTFGTTQANQRVIITFNARCSHLSGTGGVNVEILVDPGRVHLEAGDHEGGADFRRAPRLERPLVDPVGTDGR